MAPVRHLRVLYAASPVRCCPACLLLPACRSFSTNDFHLLRDRPYLDAGNPCVLGQCDFCPTQPQYREIMSDFCVPGLLTLTAPGLSSDPTFSADGLPTLKHSCTANVYQQLLRSYNALIWARQSLHTSCLRDFDLVDPLGAVRRLLHQRYLWYLDAVLAHSDGVRGHFEDMDAYGRSHSPTLVIGTSWFPLNLRGDGLLGFFELALLYLAVNDPTTERVSQVHLPSITPDLGWLTWRASGCDGQHLCALVRAAHALFDCDDNPLLPHDEWLEASFGVSRSACPDA